MKIYKEYNWNYLEVHDIESDQISKVPAHEGDFFPEHVGDHFEMLQNCHDTGFDNSWPIRADIDITQKCNANCSFCYSSSYRKTNHYKNAEIPVNQFEKLVSELAAKGTKTIRFTGGGEPLCHSEIQEMLRIPKRYGLKSCLITNGDLLTSKLAESIVSNIDHVRISINAATEKTRRELHHNSKNSNSIEEIFAHISSMTSENKRKNLNTKFWLTSLILPENISEIGAIALKAKNSGVDSISFRPIYHELSQKLSDQEKTKLDSELKKASALHNPPHFSVHIPKRNIHEVWNLIPGAEFTKCISCFTRTIIESTNKGPMISICGLHRGHHTKSLGYITTTFSELWEKSIPFLSNQIEKCEHCIDISMNKTLNRLNEIISTP